MKVPFVVSAELLALAAGESAGILFITDLEHRIVWVNGAFEHATGYTLDDVIGQLPTVIFGGARADTHAVDSIIRTLNAGERVSTSMRLYRKDGSVFWSALAIAPLKENGQLKGFLSNCIDISPTKAAEQRLANIIAGTRAGTWEWNVQTGEVHFNERWAEITGYRLDELAPVSIETWISLAHPDDLPASSAMLERHFSGQTDFYECLCRMRHRDGHDVWVHDRGQVVEWTADGRPLWMAGTHIDVTEMMLTADALRDARDKAQHVLDTVQSVIISLDREGRVTQLNPAGCALVGVTEEEILGRNWFTGFHRSEHHELLLHTYAQLMATGTPELPYTENEIVTARGDRRLLRWHHVLQRDEYGVPTGLLSSGDDITDLRQLERQVTRRQRLEAIGTLAGGIAHDLNNALSPAVMGMGVLREAAPQESALIDMIESSTKRAAQMVRQLLTFARGADGERRALEVSAVVREVERIIRTTFPKNISLTVQLESNLPRILGDATQLHQVLVNLAVNARDAMGNGGLLSIAVQDIAVNAEDASHVTVAAARPGRFLRFSVRDSGDGIADELLDRIFDPFYTTKGPERGTGLGLSTVLGIVKGHGGFIKVESRKGAGSTFHVCFPVIDEVEAPELTVEPSRALDTTGKVLFVDDEPFIRAMIAILARRIGCNALTVGSTDEALATLSRSAHHIVAVVTDLHMPGRDGLVLTKEVRARWPDMPVIIVSGLVTDDLFRQLREMSKVSMLPKPFSEAQLRHAIELAVSPGTAGAEAARLG